MSVRGRGESAGIARLICPITLNNPRDNSIARYPETVREVIRLSAGLSAICECKFPFPRLYVALYPAVRLATRN